MKLFFAFLCTFLIVFSDSFSQVSKVEIGYITLSAIPLQSKVLVKNSSTNEKILVERNVKIVFLTSAYLDNKNIYRYDTSAFRKDLNRAIDSLHDAQTNRFNNSNKPIRFDTLRSLNFKIINNIRYYNFNNQKSNVIITKTCNCEDGLIEIAGPNLHLYNITFDPGNGSDCNSTGNTCDGEEKNIGANNNYKFVDNPNLEIIKDTCLNTTTIGVLDSGIDITNSYINQNLKYFFNANFTGSPINSSDIGQINITNGNSINHGTKIINTIISELKPSENFKIVPIQISNNCPGNLFDAMCGLLKARKLKLDILNLSWGYTGDKDIQLLTSKIFYLVEKACSIIVTSAGNDSTNLDNGFFIDPSILSTGKVFSRNATHYPANFSNYFKNIITVTTVTKNGAADLSLPEMVTTSYANRSEKFIDFGVEHTCIDEISARARTRTPARKLEGFKIAGFSPDSCYYGTSFAAAIFTGKLAREFINIKNAVLIKEIDTISADFYKFTPLYPIIVGTYPATGYAEILESYSGIVTDFKKMAFERLSKYRVKNNDMKEIDFEEYFKPVVRD